MELTWALYGSGFVLLALGVLVVAKKLFDVTTPYSIDVQLTEKDNAAVGIVLVGYLLGVVAIICGTFSGGDGSGELTRSQFLSDLQPVAIYAALGTVLLLVAGVLNDKLILHKFSNTEEIIERQNTAVAVVMAASYAGSGLIVAGGVHGSTSMVSAISSFILGQACLAVFALVYQAATKYDDQRELGEQKNLAAGIALGGNLLAYSVLLMQGGTMHGAALEGVDRLWHFGYYAVLGAIFLPLLRLVSDRLFLPASRLSDEIAGDRNVNAGLIEASMALCMGVVLIFCL